MQNLSPEPTRDYPGQCPRAQQPRSTLQTTRINGTHNTGDRSFASHRRMKHTEYPPNTSLGLSPNHDRIYPHNTNLNFTTTCIQATHQYATTAPLLYIPPYCTQPDLHHPYTVQLH